MFSKFLKILFALLVLISVQNCGYQPLLTEKYQKFNINTFDISGDKKLGQMLANRFVEFKDSENQLMCKINIEKNREISNKDSAGKVLEYSLDVNINLEALSTLDGSSILRKNYSQKRSYKASKFYIDTLSREKIITDDLLKSIANQITSDLNLVYK
tara:strand:+ start:189 stop:659 length:471 start_codon:yes stop_codon:yes gene_type:complete